MPTWLVPIKNGFTLISQEDISLLSHKWAVVKPDGAKAYVAAWIGGRTVYMHRMIAGAEKGQEVDHINGDGLDNSRENLRIATRAQNCRNTPKRTAASGYRGVYRVGSRWQVKLTADGTHIHGGHHATADEAARVYDRLAREHHGEFAILNFPEQEMV